MRPRPDRGRGLLQEAKDARSYREMDDWATCRKENPIAVTAAEGKELEKAREALKKEEAGSRLIKRLLGLLTGAVAQAEAEQARRAPRRKPRPLKRRKRKPKRPRREPFRRPEKAGVEKKRPNRQVAVQGGSREGGKSKKGNRTGQSRDRPISKRSSDLQAR